MPRPIARMLSGAMPRAIRSARTRSARRSDSASLYWSVPTASVWPATVSSGAGREAIASMTWSTSACDSGVNWSVASTK